MWMSSSLLILLLQELDVRSLPCEERVKIKNTMYGIHTIEKPKSCDAQEVEIAAGQVLADALVSTTGSWGRYPNNACQGWNIIADENQVMCCFSK